MTDATTTTADQGDNLADQTHELLAALADIRDLFWVFTLPNAEPESFTIARALRSFVAAHRRRATLVPSLGRVRYVSLLRYASVMVGNSSSALIEGPSLRVPAVNIGTRQQGRLRAANVIDVPSGRRAAIRRAIRTALSPSFRRRLKGLRNPYQGRDTCRRIVEVLAGVNVGETLLKKRFHRVPR